MFAYELGAIEQELAIEHTPNHRRGRVLDADFRNEYRGDEARPKPLIPDVEESACGERWLPRSQRYAHDYEESSAAPLDPGI